MKLDLLLTVQLQNCFLSKAKQAVSEQQSDVNEPSATSLLKRTCTTSKLVLGRP